AERQGEVLGTLGAALRPLLLPGGRELRSVYLGDLKLAPAARGGRGLGRLTPAVQPGAGPRAGAAVSVAVDGTPATPERYTGRLGILPFREVGKVLVLRLATTPTLSAVEDIRATTAEQGDACYRRLSAGRYACPSSMPAERSETEPLWLLAGDGRA